MDAQKNALNAIETDLSSVYAQHLETLQQRLDASLKASEDRIAELEQKATAVTDRYVAALHELRDAIDRSQQTVDGTMKTTVASLGEAKGHVDDLNKKRDADLAEIQATLQQLEAAYNKVEADSTTGLGAVAQLSEPLVQLVRDGTQSVHQHGEELSAGMQQTQHTFADDVKTMVQTLHDFAQSVDSEHQTHDSEHDRHATQTHEHAASQINGNVQTLQEGMGIIGQAFDLLGEFGNGFGGHFGDGVKDLMSTVEEIAKIVDTIKPVLEVIKAIE